MAKSTLHTMWLEHINMLPVHEIMPGMRGRFVHSETMTFAFWDIDAGFDLPEHSHPNEQVAQLLSGRFELRINGEIKVMETGSMAVIPRHAVHSGKAVTACRIL